MESDALQIERRDAVTVLHVDDGKVNALSFDLIAAIKAAVEAADADDAVGAVVIHGREGKFSAGFDLGVMLAGDMAETVRLVADGGDLVRTLYGCGVPVVAACTGHALAAGALMLLGCDLRIGADVPAKIGLNEVAIKMVLPDWAMTIADARLSKRHLQRAIVNARVTAPADAVDAGSSTRSWRPRRCSTPPSPVPPSWRRRSTRRAYRATVRKFRGPVLDTMATQIAADRAAGVAVSVYADQLPYRSGAMPGTTIAARSPTWSTAGSVGPASRSVSCRSGAGSRSTPSSTTSLALECMQAAHDAGCNFFDNAEAYAGGKSEAIMGRVLARARAGRGTRTCSRRRCSGASTATCRT